MYEQFHLPDQREKRFWVYGVTSGSNGWQTWHKPSGISFVMITVFGGGGGGGGGTGAKTLTPPATNMPGAGGGGGGGSTSTMYPAALIPDTLYILVGSGGRGGSGAASGSTGGTAQIGALTYVSFYPNTGTGYLLTMINGASAGSPANPLTSTTAGGAAGSAATTGQYPLSKFGARQSIAGVAGNSGVATQTIQASTHRVMGGAGGSGHTTAGAVAMGAQITGSGQYAFKGQEPAQTGSFGIPAQSGSSGINDLLNFISTCGGSGGASTASAAGPPGPSGFSSGGSGGSVGFATGSDGGKGGDGLVIITCG